VEPRLSIDGGIILHQIVRHTHNTIEPEPSVKAEFASGNR